MDRDPQKSLLSVAGTEIHWKEMGQGRPLVLLHGLTDSHRTWSKVAPILAQTHRVLMPDLPGHGLSGRPDASYALAWHASVIGGWIDALGLEDIDLVGHSFGGGVAQWILLERRDRVRRLGLVAAGGLGREVSLGLRLCGIGRVVERFGQPFMAPFTRIGMGMLDAGFASEDIDWLAWMNAMPGSARALARTVQDVIDWRGQRRHFLDRAAEVPELPPMSIYWGDRDPVIPFRHAHEASLHLDGVSITPFSRCGHFPHRERPEDFAAALGRFLGAESVPAPTLRSAARVAGGLDPRPSWIVRAWRACARGLRFIAHPPSPAS